MSAEQTEIESHIHRAIVRSVSHNEIVTITVDRSKGKAYEAELTRLCDDWTSYDHGQNFEFWGVTEGDEATNWRVHLTVEAAQ